MSRHPNTVYDGDHVVIQRCLMCGYRRAETPSSYYLCCHVPIRDEAGLAH